MRAIVDTVQDPASPAPPPPQPLESVATARPGTPLTIACPAQVVTSTPFDCTLTIASHESTFAAGAALRVTLPPGLFHVANNANGRLDGTSRTLVVPLDGGPIASRKISISLIADEAGGGRTRTLSASMPIGAPASDVGQRRGGETNPVSPADPAEPVESVKPVEGVEKPRESTGESTSESAREPARVEASDAVVVLPGEPVIVGAFESPEMPLTATLLTVAAIVAALWGLRARRRARRLASTRTGGESYGSSAASTSSTSSSSLSKEALGASMIFGSVSVLLLFFCMPSCIETVRARTIFVATTCTIVDSGSSGLAPEISYVPMAIVRYEVDGRPRVASGFDVRGTMYGSNDPDASQLFPCGRPLSVLVRSRAAAARHPAAGAERHRLVLAAADRDPDADAERPARMVPRLTASAWNPNDLSTTDVVIGENR